VEKSLVILGEAPEHAAHPVVPRYRLLETVRQYARDRLRESDESTPWSAAPRQTEEERMRERHLAYFVSVAEELAPGMSGPAPRPWLERCEQEYDNLRAALEWAVSGGAIEAGPRLAEALFPFWMICGYMYEGRRWTEAVLARSSEAPLSLRARLLWLACQLAQWGVDREAARCFAEKSLALRRELGDREGILGCLDILADLARGRGDIAHAGALREEAILLTRELGRRQIAALRDLFHRASGALERGEGNTVEALCAEALALQPEWEDPIRAGGLLHGLGLLALEQESYTLARVLFERSLDLTFPEVRSERGESRRVPGPGFSPDPADYTAAWPCDVMSRRALAARCQGDLEAAWRLGKECLAYSRQMGERTLVARSLADLARVAIRREDPEAARPLLHECLTLFEEMGHPWGIAETLEACAGAASALGEPARAARLLGAADALRERAGKPLWPYERPDHARTLAAAQDALGEWSFAAAWKEGRAMAPEQAVRYALQEAASQAFARSR
jgi:tetratricopeptide (TPR) repeat protein